MLFLLKCFFKQRGVVIFLVAEMYKPCEIYIRMCHVNREACFSKNIFTTG